MPDIALCTDHECPSRKLCYRYRAIPDEHYQVYADFKAMRGLAQSCEYFEAIGRRKVKRDEEEVG